MHDSQTDAIQPSAAADKCVCRIPHSVEEDQCRPLQAEGINCDLVSVGTEGTCYGPVLSLDSGARKSQDIRVRPVEKAVRRSRIQASPQFHATIAVNQPHWDKDSGRCFLVLEIGVEFERDQSIHPPTNGSCSWGETKIRKGEESPLASTSQ